MSVDNVLAVASATHGSFLLVAHYATVDRLRRRA